MNICMKEFISFVELRQLFPYMAFVYAWIVPLWADQLLLQLLMEQFDTRVPTVREKSGKNEKNSRSGKSQGILSLVMEI